MKRLLLAAFSVMFVLNAVFSAFWLSVDTRNASTGSPTDKPAITVEIAGQALPCGTFHTDADPDSPTDNLLAAESFVALDGMQTHLREWARGQIAPYLGAQLAAPPLPWTYLKVLLRPPRLLV